MVGLIGAMAQCMNTLYSELLGANDKEAAAMVTLTLIVLSVILTGTGHFKKIAKWAGAGVLVPITGFANSVAAPAIEFKKEGWVYGTGCKIFTIAGPVILYGVARGNVYSEYMFPLKVINTISGQKCVINSVIHKVIHVIHIFCIRL